MELETKQNFYYFDAYFYCFLVHLIELLFCRVLASVTSVIIKRVELVAPGNCFRGRNLRQKCKGWESKYDFK